MTLMRAPMTDCTCEARTNVLGSMHDLMCDRHVFPEVEAVIETAKDVVNDTPPFERTGFIARLADALHRTED